MYMLGDFSFQFFSRLPLRNIIRQRFLHEQTKKQTGSLSFTAGEFHIKSLTSLPYPLTGQVEQALR